MCRLDKDIDDVTTRVYLAPNFSALYYYSPFHFTDLDFDLDLGCGGCVALYSVILQEKGSPHCFGRTLVISKARRGHGCLQILN